MHRSRCRLQGMEGRTDRKSKTLGPKTRRPVHLPALGLAALALLICWIPWFGLTLAIAALVVSLLKRRQARVGWAMGISIYALLLGGGFTSLEILFPAAKEGRIEAETWEDFDKLFEEGEEG